MFEDEFLDDQDLFNEMLLSKEDACELYHRGEITREQLNWYLDKLGKSQQTKQEPDNWVKFALLIVLLGSACVFFTCIIAGGY